MQISCACEDTVGFEVPVNDVLGMQVAVEGVSRMAFFNQAQPHTQTHARMHTHTHAYTPTHAHTCIHTYPRRHTHASMHTHTHAHTSTHTHPLYSLHSLCALPCNVYQPKHVKLRVIDMEVAVEAVPHAPLRHNGEGLTSPSHKEEDVAMASLPVGQKW